MFLEVSHASTGYTREGGVVLKRYQLAIVVKEKEYTRRLVEYIRGSSFGERWQVSAFTHSNACKQYAKQGYVIDCIVVETEQLPELESELPSIPTIVLVDKLGETGKPLELLQYQALPLLLKGISERFDGSVGRSLRSIHWPNKAEAKVLTIHSASGGVGKTTLALHLAHAACARGLRIFYLNLERWNTMGLWLDELSDRGEGLSELLYAIKAGSSEPSQWIAKRRRYHTQLKFDYLPGFRHAEDRISLSADDASAMVDALTQSSHYDHIIVDLDAGVEDMHITLLERSDHNLWVVTDDLSVMKKQSLFMRYGRQKWGEKFGRIMVKSELVRNRISEDSEVVSNQLEMAVAPILIPEVKEWRFGEQHPILSSSSYRAAADRLLLHALRERGAVHAIG